MGRALIITCAGLIVAFGFTIMSVTGQKESMAKSNVNTYYKAKVSNAAHTGVQIAIQEFNEDESNDPDVKDEKFSYSASTEDVDLSLTVKENVEIIGGENTEIVKITSKAEFKGVEKTVIAVFDISKSQALVPEFEGALSILNGDVVFQDGNHKVHFNGNDITGQCEDKPGLTVPESSMISEHDDNETIAGNPPVDQNNDTKFEEITDLIEALDPYATTVTQDFDWSTSTKENPGVYFVEDNQNFSGQDTGWGILVIRNNALIEVYDFAVSGQFEFNGLVIFENENHFSGTGKAQFNGSVIAGTNDGTTFEIKANGNFEAQYDCTKRKYAEMAVNKALNTTLYKRLSIYE